MKKKVIWIVIIVAAVLFVAWIIWSNVTVGVTYYTVSDDKIPSAFDGYKIVQLSDVHSATYGQDNEMLVALVEKEEPDIIALTGDLVDSNRTDVDVAVDLVRKLVAVAPCYYVTGNHEARLGEVYEALEQKLLDLGVVVLHNDIVTVTKDGETIQIVGVDDPGFSDNDGPGQSGMQTVLKEMNLSQDYCVLLSHRPELFGVYVTENVDLALCGHAHGGQFRLPFVGGVFAPNQGFFPKYDAGTYTENGTTMVVSRGVGNSLCPIRFNNRPEIVVIEMLTEK